MEPLIVQTQPMSVTEPQASEKLDACSVPLAAGIQPRLSYRYLINQHAQKLRKPAPMYQTNNEGSDHLPKFRSTVWIDGVSYTSSNTFPQRKMAEMDVSKVAYCAIIRKSKDEALHLVQEDKHFCKSILVEYAAKMDIEKPNYETIQLGILAPGAVFRSSLVFNGVAYSGDIGKSKKEAEQLAARAAILKYLESESGNDMLDIVHSKFKHRSAGTFVGALTGIVNNNVLSEAKVDSGNSTIPKSSVVMESCLVQGTAIPATCLTSVITQQPIPIVSVEAVTPAISVLNQPPDANVSIETITPVVPIVTQSPLSKVSTNAFSSAVPAPVILTQVPSAEINNSSTPPIVSALCLGQLGNVPEAHISSDVIQPANSKASPGTIVPPLPLVSQALEPMPVIGQIAGQTSGRKRNRNNKKKAQKKMRAQMEIPVMPMGEVPPCSSA